jgi:hypothetical protein
VLPSGRRLGDGVGGEVAAGAGAVFHGITVRPRQAADLRGELARERVGAAPGEAPTRMRRTGGGAACARARPLAAAADAAASASKAVRRRRSFMGRVGSGQAGGLVQAHRPR